jgi:hypothetical protein
MNALPNPLVAIPPPAFLVLDPICGDGTLSPGDFL